MNGLELCECIRSHPQSRGLPIIMLTAKGFELSINDIRRDYGVVELLSKPFSPRELLQLVDDTLENSLQDGVQVSPESNDVPVDAISEVLP